MTPRCSAVATSAPGRAGVAQRAQVLDVAHAAAGEQLEVAERGVELGDQPDVRPRAAAHPREVEHDHLAQPRAVQARHGVERRQARELRVGRQQRGRRAGPRSGPRPSGSSASSRSSASGPVSVSVPTIDAVRAEIQQRPRPFRLADARVDHDARLARQRARCVAPCSPSPLIASRSAT